MTKFKLVGHFKMIKMTSYLTQKFNLIQKGEMTLSNMLMIFAQIIPNA